MSTLMSSPTCMRSQCSHVEVWSGTSCLCHETCASVCWRNNRLCTMHMPQGTPDFQRQPQWTCQPITDEKPGVQGKQR